MKTQGMLAFCLAVGPSAAFSATLLDTNGTQGFKCEDDVATAVWTSPQETDLDSDGRLLTVEVIYMWADTQIFQDFKFKLRFSGGSGNATEFTANTSGTGGGSARLSQSLDTGGDRYFKSFDLTIYAEVKDKANNQLLDSASDTMTFTVFDTTWKIPTQTNITSPTSSVYKFDDIAVNGTVKRKPDGGGNWQNMDDGKYVDIAFSNGANQMSAAVQTQNGNFSHTFVAPDTGWDDRVSYTVTATFRADQFEGAPYYLTYESSSDSEQHAITSKRKQGKSWGESFIDRTLSTTIENPTADVLPDGSTLTFDLDGSQVGSGALIAPPPHGTVVIDEDTLDDDLTGSSGSIEIDGLIPGYETWAQTGTRATSSAPLFAQPGPAAWVGTLAYPLPAGWTRALAFQYLPPAASPAQLTLRFYSAAGSLLHTENASLVPHERFEVPEAWLPGAASVHGEISQGFLAGWDNAVMGSTDAFGTVARTSPVAEASAPYVAASGGWTTELILHNPTDNPTTVEIRWYTLSGTPLYTATPTIGPKQTLTYDGNVIAPGLDKSVDVVALSGDGVIGTCVRVTVDAATMAESMVTADAALRLPSPGTPLLDNGQLVLHNPDGQGVNVDIQSYDLGGASLGTLPETVPPFSTVVVPLSPPGVGEPMPSMAIRTVGGGRVAAMAMFGQSSNGGVCSVPALPMPDIARCEPPDLQNGWNLTSIPLDPDQPAVELVLAAVEQAGNVLANAVLTYDGTGYLTYPAEMSNLSRGEGFWLNLSNSVPFSVVGEAAGEDTGLSLRKGWTLIGHPMTTARLLTDCSITDGVNTKSVAQAGLDGWIQSTFYTYAPSIGYLHVNPDGTGDDDQLRPCYGYWVRSYRQGLTLIVPVNPGGGPSPPSGGAAAMSSSQVHIQLASTGGSLPWDFYAGIDAAGASGVDPLDLAAPPSPPAGLVEVRFTSQMSPEGSFTVDSRPKTCGQPVVWSATAEAFNFTPGQCEQVTMTWDLTDAGSYAYQLVDVGAAQTIDLMPGGQYVFQICDQPTLAFELRAEIPGIIPSDLDCDSDVDTNDFLTFSNCFNGSLNPPRAACANPKADHDGDGDVDVNDFLTFSNCFNGSLNPPRCP